MEEKPWKTDEKNLMDVADVVAPAGGGRATLPWIQ